MLKKIKGISNFFIELKEKILNIKVIKNFREKHAKAIKFIATAISWSVFVILILCAIFLIYYYISMKNYAAKGAGYEPKISLYTIISGSMSPTINVYDVVVVFDVDDPTDIEVGDVINYNSSEFISGETISVTHRVVEIVVDKNGEYTYYTKGDNNLARDPDGVEFTSIIGVVEMKIPQLGRLQFFLASKIGWLLIIVLPAVFILLKYIMQLVNIPGLLDKLYKDGKFLPILKKQVLLTYNDKKDFVEEKELDSQKLEPIVIPDDYVFNDNLVVFEDKNENLVINSDNKTEVQSPIEKEVLPKENDINHVYVDESISKNSRSFIEKNDESFSNEIELDNIFDDLQDLLK